MRIPAKDVPIGARVRLDCGCEHVRIKTPAYIKESLPYFRFVQAAEACKHDAGYQKITGELAHERPLFFKGWTFEEVEVVNGPLLVHE